MAERDQIKSLKKALRAITYLNQQGDCTVSQVAAGIEVPRATAYRLLATLASEGYVDKLPNSDIYRLTSLVRSLSTGFRDEELLLELARPLLAEAQRELGWSIGVSTPRGSQMVMRLNTDYESPLALIRHGIGGSRHLLVSACGYCYLAHCTPAESEAMITAGLADPDHEHPMPFDRQQIQERVQGVRDEGFCSIEFDHEREGNLGVPLLLAGRPVGGILMRYIKSTMRSTDRLRSSYVPRLQRLALEIAQRHPAHRDHGERMAGLASGTAAEGE
ncbi:helix-turn-helix domain-containing protein [Roseateles sp. LYH14W]|uniref:Helix-turn-helix domain-containing protein n=1 Tax=Pelomonas parva TaxID=3299032 RepID=A0ABW7EX77_9BURK